MEELPSAEVPNTELSDAVTALITSSTHAELSASVTELLNRCRKEDRNFTENRYLHTREIYFILLGRLH